MGRITNKRNSKKKANNYGKFIDLYKGGYSVAQIEKMLPVTYVTLYNWLHEALAKGELTKGGVASIPALDSVQSGTEQNEPHQKSPLNEYLAKEPPASIKLSGLPQLAEEVVKAMSKSDQKSLSDDYENMSKEELITIIAGLKKAKSEDEIKIKAYQTVIEIAGRNIGEELLKKVGAKQSGR